MEEVRREIREALARLAAAPERSVLRPPTDAETLHLVDRALRRAGFPGLPADYAVLLTHACGIQGPYFTLLGPGGMPLAGGGIQPGIEHESRAFNADTDLPARWLVLGKASGGVVLACTEDGYSLIDAQSRDVLQRYDTVAAFIGDMLTRRHPPPERL